MSLNHNVIQKKLVFESFEVLYGIVLRLCAIFFYRRFCAVISLDKALVSGHEGQKEQPEELRARAVISALAQITIPIDGNAERPPAALPGYFITISSMLPQSLLRGGVHIRSKTPPVSLQSTPNYLSHPTDIEIMAHHILQTKKIASLSQLSNLLAKLLTQRDPAAGFTDFEAAKAYTRGNAISMWNLGGTCAMLSRKNAGVVDTSHKVYGVDDLGVVDASAIRLISTASLQVAVYAFAEKAADIIKMTGARSRPPGPVYSL